VPRQTLSAIMRGRIAGISGWVLFNQNKPPEAVVRLTRAVSVLPEKSAWWRSSMWRLGVAFDADGSPQLALDAYVKSYLSAPPDAIKYSVIETVYQKVNGSLEGLDKKIGAKPVDTIAVAATPETPSVLNNEAAKTESSPIAPTPEATPTLPSKISETPKSEVTPKPSPIPETKTGATVKPSQTTAKTSTPSPFEPIIITVPKTEIVKSPKSDSETAQANNQDSKTSEKPKNSTSGEDSGKVRPRVSDAKNTENTDCQLEVGQESITILANGGNLGVLVGFEGGGDISKIVASSSNPTDIDVSLDPDIGKQSNHAFFIIKSISAKTGIFTITFESPCGKKEVRVKVR
ncbi:MAG: hypothetical protein ACR2N3_10010, partial [Pyrinomonadaceae bacterium]